MSEHLSQALRHSELREAFLYLLEEHSVHMPHHVPERLWGLWMKRADGPQFATALRDCFQRVRADDRTGVRELWAVWLTPQRLVKGLEELVTKGLERRLAIQSEEAVIRLMDQHGCWRQLHPMVAYDLYRDP
jgi:hypothetical protein